MKKIQNLPNLEFTNILNIKDNRRCLLITSPTAEVLAKPFLQNINITQTIFIANANKNYVDDLLTATNIANIDICYAVGGGKVVDVARYLASRWNLEIICIPTIVSTDAFLVDCTGLRESKSVIYIPSKKADKVAIDFSLISQSDPRYNLSGCGDVLSIYTALYDWKESNDNYIEGVASVARGILNGLMSDFENIKNMNESGLMNLITQLAMEVQLCYLYGNSRPEEGGEHFYVYCLENKLESNLHGEMVCFGILLTSFLQGQSTSFIKNFMDSVNINYRPKGLTRDMAFEVYKDMPTYVKEKKFARSVWNYFPYQQKEEEVKNFISTIL